MLENPYPLSRTPHQFVTLLVLGPVAEEFSAWLAAGGYTRSTAHVYERVLRRLDRYLSRRGVRSMGAVRHAHIEGLRRWLRCRDPNAASAVRTFQRFLEARGLVRESPTAAPTRTNRLLEEYAVFLRDVRGFASLTIHQHVVTGAELLDQVGYEAHPARLSSLGVRDVEALVGRAGRRLARASLQHFIARVRGFLKFLASSERVQRGLDAQIDTPRIYRDEQLPRSLPWPTVQAFLRSIDRKTPFGCRDYAMFLLIATYGLRGSDIVKLSLDDLDWRAAMIHVLARKNGQAITLPLTDAVGAAIVAYLRRARPDSQSRTLFLKCRAPFDTLTSAAVSMALDTWAQRSGLMPPIRGSHCLRHSYAVALLRRGISLEVIGDLLGHRSAESTCVYLRLATDDLRCVALALPRVGDELGRARS
jgi:integrase/recombinase XerD